MIQSQNLARSPAATSDSQRESSCKPEQVYPYEDIYLIKALHNLRFDDSVIATAMLRFRALQLLGKIPTTSRENELGHLILQQDIEIKEVLDRFDEYEATVDELGIRKGMQNYVTQALETMNWLMPPTPPGRLPVEQALLREFSNARIDCVGKKVWVENLWNNYHWMYMELWPTEDSRPSTPVLGSYSG
ncbi:MAG: hypothetical protein LQ350_004332 [Teloschistes chrysophthalmus]|nr:MAG: hypothetical protein LQ350_004332 [Niorma chrysophthalma]